MCFSPPAPPLLRSRAAAGLLAASLLLPLTVQGVSAQQQSVGGMVVESSTRRPIIGAQVSTDGRGAITDNRGRFLIVGLTGSQVTLRVVMIGFREIVQTVDVGRTDLVLPLVESAMVRLAGVA